MNAKNISIACVVAAAPGLALADYVGLGIEPVDTVAMGWVDDAYPTSELDTYRVYALFDGDRGLVSAVGDALDMFSFSMTSGDGAFFSVFPGPFAPDEALAEFFPESQWESWISIGTPDDPLYWAAGFTEQTGDFSADFWLNDTGWLSAVTAPPVGNGVFAVDGRVLIAQVTVADGRGIRGSDWRVSGREGQDMTEFDVLASFEVEGRCVRADLNDDGRVGLADLTALLATWGVCPGCPADLDGNGDVGFSDLTGLLAAWGDCAF